MNGIDYTFCELREKMVVNICDGKQLGRIIDICVHCGGKVVGLIAPGDTKFFKSLKGCDGIFIPWQNVVRIGDDVILVDLQSGMPPMPCNNC
ncbi:MAG: YlmC/YmxH family sporulation protein [Clostridiales bacterium]|nr:YlmC/YmxH family sporulation protein [Clostridiales bacterium]HOB64331.1 YlmC/YmxH family sporulation protein [Clostridia bacterium]HOK81540.1 YlmC/YmxH family sporulation protein [Clostridia bacterium]HOL60986.1 YlmC/YmxH family sporulation protein [Clostridia bacterium]HPO53422.1 YlmC/YmxH family sporulation protein [Clostridia bacterium]